MSRISPSAQPKTTDEFLDFPRVTHHFHGELEESTPPLLFHTGPLSGLVVGVPVEGRRHGLLRKADVPPRRLVVSVKASKATTEMDDMSSMQLYDIFKVDLLNRSTGPSLERSDNPKGAAILLIKSLYT